MPEGDILEVISVDLISDEGTQSLHVAPTLDSLGRNCIVVWFTDIFGPSGPFPYSACNSLSMNGMIFESIGLSPEGTKLGDDADPNCSSCVRVSGGGAGGGVGGGGSGSSDGGGTA